jgi:hypothetical protein
VPGVDETSIKLGLLTDFSGPGKHPGSRVSIRVPKFIRQPRSGWTM